VFTSTNKVAAQGQKSEIICGFPASVHFLVDRLELDAYAEWQRWMLRQQLNAMVHVLDLEHGDPAEPFLGFGLRAIGNCYFAGLQP
jgi:hypothetical protein